MDYVRQNLTRDVAFPLSDRAGELDDVLREPARLGEYIRQLETQLQLPRVLFVVASLMTAGMLLLLCRQLPDFFVRALLWLRSHGRHRHQWQPRRNYGGAAKSDAWLNVGLFIARACCRNAHLS